MNKYETFNNWFEEIENYGLRLERFHEEFSMVDISRRERMIEWLYAAWTCAREQKDVSE